MSQRMLFRLLGTAVLLGVVWLLVTSLSRPDGPGEVDAAELNAVLAEFVPTDLRSIRIASGPDAVRLERTDGRWTVNGMRADSGLVAGFLNAMNEAAVTNLAARNPDNHRRMGVAADSTITLSFDAGTPTRTLLIGKSGPGYGTSFVRLPDQDAVYVVDGGIRSHVVRPVDGWRDKRLVAVDTAAIDELHVRRDDEEYVIARADSTWSLGDAVAEPSVIRDMLSELSDLRATGFLAESDSLALQPPGVWVTALDAAGDTLAAVSLGQGDVDRWGRALGDPVIYRVPSWRVERLAPARNALVTGS